MSDTIDMTTTRTRTYTPAECARHNARLHALRRWATCGTDMLERIIEAGSDDLRAATGVLTFEWAEPIAVRIERTECGWRRCHAEHGALFVVDPAWGVQHFVTATGQQGRVCHVEASIRAMNADARALLDRTATAPADVAA